MNETSPPEDLLARMAERDETALTELYDRYAPRVYGLMTQILPSRDAAEEALQDVFLRLWSESPNLSLKGGSTVAWLVLTARTAALDRLRAAPRNAPDTGKPRAGRRADDSVRKAKASAAGPRDPASRPTRSGNVKPFKAEGTPANAMGLAPSSWLPDPEEIALIDDRLALLHKVINQLPKPQRQALELAVFRGLKEPEIAAEMGEPLGKVRSSLRAAVTFVKHRRRAVCGTWAANI